MIIRSEQDHLVQELREEATAPLHRLIIDHGVAFEPARLPSDIEPGERRCCFYNAFSLASSQPDRFTYFEGFATYRFPTAEGQQRSWPHRHAWCVETSAVIDPTWRQSPTLEPLAYRGIALPPDLAAPFATRYSRGPLYHNARTVEVVYYALGLEPPSPEGAGE